MGSETSSLRNEGEEGNQVKYFMPKETSFTKEEMKEWYRGFQKFSSDGKARPEEFKKVYNEYFPRGDATEFSKHVFRLFDTNGDGVVDFREFISAMAITLHGSLDERIKWAFSMYDIDGSGEISEKEMLSVLVAFGKMIGESAEWPADERTPYGRMEKLFKILDKNKDAKISLQELSDAAHCEPYIAKLFSYGDHKKD